MTLAEATITTPDDEVLLTRTWAVDTPRASVLIVHGAAEHSIRYDHVAAFLNDRDFSVFSYDQRGHGQTTGGRVDIGDFAWFLDDIQLVYEQQIAPTGHPWVLYGHSMGGLEVVRYLEDPDRPQPVAAVVSAPALDADVSSVLRVASEVLGRFTPWIRLPAPWKSEQLSRDPAVTEAYDEDPHCGGTLSTRIARQMLNEGARAKDDMNRISVPTLVIHGAEDEIVPPRASAPLAAVDGVERKVYPGLRHEMHNEPEQEVVLTDVADWLDAILDQIATS
jgi:alpha-beta hydrolase superfamily lysophospholipase